MILEVIFNLFSFWWLTNTKIFILYFLLHLFIDLSLSSQSKMPITTRARVQSEIPFQCRKTRSSNKTTKGGSKNKTKKKCLTATINTDRATEQLGHGRGKGARRTGVAATASMSGEWAVSRSPRKRQLCNGMSSRFHGIGILLFYLVTLKWLRPFYLEREEWL